jgi:hypothetical protein
LPSLRRVAEAAVRNGWSEPEYSEWLADLKTVRPQAVKDRAEDRKMHAAKYLRLVPNIVWPAMIGGRADVIHEAATHRGHLPGEICLAPWALALSPLGAGALIKASYLAPNGARIAGERNR